MKVSNGLCQSPSFLGQEELGSGYEIGTMDYARALRTSAKRNWALGTRLVVLYNPREILRMRTHASWNHFLFPTKEP